MASEQATEEVPDTRKELESNDLLPAVAQFVSLYRFAFKLPEIEIEELEDGILEANEVGGKVLQDLLIALLKGINPSRGVNCNNLEENLQKALRKFWKQEKNEDYPFPDETTFSQIDVSYKVEFLHYLCCTRVDKSDAQEAMKTMDAEALRMQALGNDDQGNEYWYFYGLRLYKQLPSNEKSKNWAEEWDRQKEQSFNKRGRGRPKKVKPRKSDGESDDFEDVKTGNRGRYMTVKERSRWTVVCKTIADWVGFAEKLKRRRSKTEKALFENVTNKFLPRLNEIYLEKERKLQQKVQELVSSKHVITRRVTRRQRVKSVQDMNGYDEETAHREHLARDRARRLEERNRRLTQSAERSKSRVGRRRKYVESDEEEEEVDDSEDEDDFQELLESVPSSDDSNDYRKNYVPVVSGESASLKSQVLKVLSEVKLHKDAWPFLYPVDEGDAPGYYEIISNPMDLATMTTKLLDNAYKTIGDIDEDFKKIVNNCKLYNGENSAMSTRVKALWILFRKGMSKIQDPTSQTPNTSRSEPRTMEFPQQDDNSSNDYQMKKSSQSQGKKKKKRIKNMDALEMLSEQAKIAVEKSQSKDITVPQPSQFNLYSDLKIVPIHNHPAELIEKFSDSSNQEMDDLDSSNASASSYIEQGSPVLTNTEKESQYLPQNEDSSDLTELINKNDGKGFNILSDGEGNNPSIISDNESDIQPASNTTYGASHNSKTLPNSDGLAQHESPNVLEEPNSGNMSSLMSGLPRETTQHRISPVACNLVDAYSTQNSSGYLRKSPLQDLNSFASIPSAAARNASTLQGLLQMQKSNSSNTNFEITTIINSKKSPQQSMSSFAGIPSATGRSPTLLQELPQTHSQNNPRSSNEMTTIDISALGMSNMDYSNKQIEVPAAATSQVPHPENQSMDAFLSSNPFAKIPNQTSPKSKPRYSPTFSQQQQVLSSANLFQNQPISQSQDFNSNVQRYQTQRSDNSGHSPVNISNNSVMQYQTQRSSNVDPSMSNNSIENETQGPGNHSPNSIATFTTHMTPQSSGNSTTMMQVPSHLSKKFHSHGQMMVQQNSDSNKFRGMKVALPPSTGELLVVPGDPSSNSGMTFHLFAQPHANMAQPIQARMQLEGDGSIQALNNQVNGMDSQYATPMRKPSVEDNKIKGDSPQQSKRSPVVQYLQASTTGQPTRSMQAPLQYSEAPYTTASMIPNIAPPLVRPNALRHSGPLPHTTVQENSRPTFLQTTTAPYTPTYSYRQASANGATLTNSTGAPKTPRINVQKVFLPPPNHNAAMQNGQYILLPQQAKDGAKRSPQSSPKQQAGVSRIEAAVPGNFHPGANNMFAFQPAVANPSQMYTQVLPGALPQYVNHSTPYYIVTDPNSIQNPQRYPLMNMQPIPFPNR